MNDRFLLPSYDTPHKSHHLRAKGNLTYLEFIRLVESLWKEVSPRVNFVASGGPQAATYPSIVYSLQLRKTHPNEPKPRYREEIATLPGEDAIIIAGQRFQNVINFTAVSEVEGGGPKEAEALIETFEDFMLEITPVLKEMGISEIVYARRLPDDEQPRVGEGVVSRTISYLVTTEKVIQTTVGKLERLVIRARQALGSTPTFTASSTTNRFTFFGVSFDPGEVVILGERLGETFPTAADTSGHTLKGNQAYYIHSVFDSGTGREYLLSAEYHSTPDDPFTVTAGGSGYVAVGDPMKPRGSVTIEIEDEHATPQ